MSEPFEKEPTMSKVHTHYDNLKVARDAPPEVIRAAYKTLCHKFHPDRHGGSAKATQAFQLVNSAYAVLSDPVRRLKHDEWIAKMEASSERPRAQASPSRWNGKERRRRPWSVPPVAPTVAEMGGKLKRSGASVALWASAGVLGAMLFLLYHA